MDINDLFDGIMKSINRLPMRSPHSVYREKCSKLDEVRRMGVKNRRILSRKRSGV
jgi:hypothetical protein